MYKIGKYILNEKRVFEFIKLVFRDLNAINILEEF